MTSWPWMKGVGFGIADRAIVPLNENDKRESVQDIITKHSQKIQQVKQAIHDDPLYHSLKHDDLWIVRFILSNRKLDQSVKAIKRALRFREERNLDKTDIRHSDIHKAEQTQKFFDCCDEDYLQYHLPDPQRGVVAFCSTGSLRHDLLVNLKTNEWIDAFVYIAEWTHQWLDYVTRTTGRLTKAVRLLDLSGLRLSDISFETLKRSSEVLHAYQDCYPQALGSIKVCNPPKWFHIPWKLCRVLLPKRVIDKADFVCPAENQHEKRSLLQYVDEEHLPERFGGKNKDWPIKFPLPE